MLLRRREQPPAPLHPLHAQGIAHARQLHARAAQIGDDDRADSGSALKCVAKRTHLFPVSLGLVWAIDVAPFYEPQQDALLRTRSRSVPAQHCV